MTEPSPMPTAQERLDTICQTTALEKIDIELAKLGIPEDRRPDAAIEIEAAIHHASVEASAKLWVDVLRSLELTSGGVALRRVLLGSQGVSRRQDARMAGISDVALLKLERRIKARLSRMGG